MNIDLQSCLKLSKEIAEGAEKIALKYFGFMCKELGKATIVR